MHKNKTPRSKSISLKDYYKTPHWKEIKKKWVKDDSRCEICGIVHREKYKIGAKKGKWKPKVNIQFHVHHKHYGSLFHEKREDFMVLCQVCHDMGHRLEMFMRTRGHASLYHDWCRMTGWRYEKRK